MLPENISPMLGVRILGELAFAVRGVIPRSDVFEASKRRSFEQKARTVSLTSPTAFVWPLHAIYRDKSRA